MAQDYYKILGVERNATDEELKKAYKKAALLYHPDRQQGKSEEEKKKAEETFKSVNEAYHILSDKDKRRQYDTFGTVDGNFSSMNAEDAMSEFMHHFSSGFSGFGNMWTEDFFNQGPRVVRGTSIQVNVPLTLSELIKQKRKTIKYSRYATCEHCHGTGSKDGKTTMCPHCNGNGHITTTQRKGFTILQQTVECPYCKGSGKVITDPCQHCNGRGLKRQEDTFTFNIPNGATHNTFITAPERGNEPEGGKGVRGDLKIVFHVDAEQGFTIDNTNPYNVIYECKMPILDCITGGTHSFKYVDGTVHNFKIPTGAKEGQRIDIGEYGIYDVHGRRGHLIAVIHQSMPSTLSNRTIGEINKLKNCKEFK